MRIGIVADSHSNHANVARVVCLLEDRRIGTVLHCGDIADAATVEAFGGFTAYFVFGNVDYDRDELRAAMHRSGAVCCDVFGELELDGRKIALLHGDDKRRLEDAERSGRYDLLCYGHTHRAEQHLTGTTRVLNPGALHRARRHTLAVYDTEAGTAEIIEV